MTVRLLPECSSLIVSPPALARLVSPLHLLTVKSVFQFVARLLCRRFELSAVGGDPNRHQKMTIGEAVYAV